MVNHPECACTQHLVHVSSRRRIVTFHFPSSSLLHLPGSPARVLVGSTEDVQGEAHERAQELVEVDPSVVRRCGLLLLMDKRVKESDAKEGRPKRQRDSR